MFYKDSADRIKAFENERDRAAGGNCTIVPTVRIVTNKEDMGSTRHLLHDYLGVVHDIETQGEKVFISGSLPISKAEGFKGDAKKSTYITGGRIQYTATRWKMLKS